MQNASCLTKKYLGYVYECECGSRNDIDGGLGQSGPLICVVCDLHTNETYQKKIGQATAEPATAEPSTARGLWRDASTMPPQQLWHDGGDGAAANATDTATAAPSERTLVVTASPTASPTLRTAAPRSSPMPTTEPSTSPSFDPSVAPTEEPTAAPTLVPSLEPSYPPSLLPSPTPTDRPTPAPSAAPSPAPTNKRQWLVSQLDRLAYTHAVVARKHARARACARARLQACVYACTCPAAHTDGRVRWMKGLTDGRVRWMKGLTDGRVHWMKWMDVCVG